MAATFSLRYDFLGHNDKRKVIQEKKIFVALVYRPHLIIRALRTMLKRKRANIINKAS